MDTFDQIIEAHNHFARTYKTTALQLSDHCPKLRITMLALGVHFSMLRFRLEETQLEPERYTEALYELGRIYSGLRLIQVEARKTPEACEVVEGKAYQSLYQDIETMKAGWTEVLLGPENTRVCLTTDEIATLIRWVEALPPKKRLDGDKLYTRLKLIRQGRERRTSVSAQEVSRGSN